MWHRFLLPVAFFLLPFLISWLLTASLVRLAPRLGLVDQPNARKIHARRTPSGGGLAIYAATVIGALVLPQGLEGNSLTVLAVGLAVVVLGLVDDLRPLAWQLRLAVQTAAAAAVVFGGPADFGWLGRLGAVLWIVSLVNAFNMLDNMDALSAGVAWIAAAVLALAVLFRQGGAWNWQATAPYLIFMGALSGFLWFNRPPARIFMGDAGSTFLGFFLGVRSLDDSLEDLTVPPRWAVPLCILAVPWYDLATVVALRIWQGRSPFHADKQHLSHRLVKLGLSSPVAVCVIYLLALASGAGGLLLYQVSQTGAALVAVQLVAFWLAVAAIEYAGHYRM